MLMSYVVMFKHRLNPISAHSVYYVMCDSGLFCYCSYQLISLCWNGIGRRKEDEAEEEKDKTKNEELYVQMK